jgi:hypothetical protein
VQQHDGAVGDDGSNCSFSVVLTNAPALVSLRASAGTLAGGGHFACRPAERKTRYFWWLSRPTSGPYEGCWMTDGVQEAPREALSGVMADELDQQLSHRPVHA